jgi:endonuclease/exonuclease/phosphatase family metal-dependent hydrolase
VTPAVRLHPLPSPRPASRTSVEQRLIMCVQLDGPRLQVCNAHFSIRDQDPSGVLRARQADQLALQLWFGERLGYATVVGGDLNATPSGTVQGGTAGGDTAGGDTAGGDTAGGETADGETAQDGTARGGRREILRPLYELATECEPEDRDRPTYGAAKIDYLFAGRGLSRVACDVVSRPESDHRALVGRFRPEPTDGAAPAAEPLPAARRGAFIGPVGTGADSGALAEALRRRAAGLEVEVRERDGALVLGGSRADPWGRTLDASFLRPLRQWTAAGTARNEVRVPAAFTLVLDLGKDPTRKAYEALERALRPYRDMLFRLDGGREVRAAVRIVVPDSAGLRQHFRGAAGRSTSFLFVEARQSSLTGDVPGLPRDAVAVVSVRLPELARGLIGGSVDPAVLERQVRSLHQRGYLVRVSGLGTTGKTPVDDRTWTTLLDAGVDLIEVDDVGSLGGPSPARAAPGPAQAD